MRLEKWFISNLDDSQRKIIVQSINDDIIVQGAAGSGKTNLAIHRALQAKGKGSYAIVIFTVALKRMIAYGMQALGLDKERIAYEWAWTNRGFDLTGDVYWERGNRNILYLVNDLDIRKFVRSEKSPTSYGIDFADWVDDRFYYAFGRRVSWFKETTYTSGFDVTNTERFELIPSGTMYKQSEDVIDYLIIDEAQDFNIIDYNSKIIPHKGKSLSLFGDSVQQMNYKGSSIDEIASVLNYKRFTLEYNYRLPKSIAKVAQQLQDIKIDLLTNNLKDGGNSDYPNYPKPTITKYSSKEKELEGIVNRIKMEDLDDVAILLPNEEDVREVNKYLNDHGIKTQVHYRTRKVVPFRTINTLDFSNNDLPCILTYYAAKGSEFDNVFVPFANEANGCTRNSFYVACTRSSRSLYISYAGKRISYLNNVSPDFVVENEIQ
ncbi:ATP-binding domain-containing protein [Bacteroides uniformis]|nr:ATP-binding domain-containing protein [Bacteroides uniformis]